MELKHLKNLVKLHCRIAVYVPSTVNVDESADNSVYLSTTARLLAELFGGSTSTPALGYWESDSKGLVSEKVDIVYSYCTTEQLEASIDSVYAHCLYLKESMRQEAISLEVNGELYFV